MVIKHWRDEKRMEFRKHLNTIKNMTIFQRITWNGYHGYMQRLGFLPKTWKNCFRKIEQLTEIEWNELHYIFYMTPKATPRPKQDPRTFRFYVSGAKMTHEIFERFMEEHSEMDCVISTPCIFNTE